MNMEDLSMVSPDQGTSSERRHSLRDTVMGKLMPYVRKHMAKRDDSQAESSTKPFKSLADLISFTAKSTVLGRVKIDSRHMWIAKRIAQSAGDSVPLSRIEELIASPFHLSKINEFLGPFGSPCLFINLSRNETHLLTIESQAFDAENEKMMYLVRLGGQGAALPSENFEQRVIFGEFRSGIKSLALVLQNVYSPMLHAGDDWGCSTDDDRSIFREALSRFSATLTGIVCTIDSRAHLLRQDPGLLPALKSSRGNRDDHLKQLEDVALGWKNAADSVLSDEDPTLRSLLDVRPDSPLLFWRQRLANLNALSEEFDAANTKEVIAVLKASGSHISETLSTVEDRIRETIMEARENVKHLSALGKHFEVLYGGTLGKIAEAVGGIFSKVKRIRVISKYLQDTDNMNGLLFKITSQIIQRCKAYIVEGGNIWEQSCSDLLIKLKECLHLNKHCQSQYRSTKHERTGATRELPFVFDESQIFGKFELFSDRLEKLIEIFDVQNFFEILASQDIIDVRSVCTRYFQVIKAFSSRSSDPLDETDTLFESDYEKLCTTTLALEKSLCKAIDKSFDGIHSTDQSLDLLSAFGQLLPRQSLRPYLNAKHIEILGSFIHEMESITNMYEVNKADPPIVRHAPPVAGKIIWVRQLLRLLEVPMQKFKKNGALLISPNARAAVKKYNKIAKTLVDYEILWERVWCSMAECAKQCLNSSILVRHPVTHQLHINFDQTIIQLFRECHYMQKLQINMPPCAQAIMDREQALKQHLDSLKYMISLCENCRRMVQPDCQSLLQPLITEMERIIRPGMVTLVWASASVEGYICDVLDFVNRFQIIVAKIRDIYDNRICYGLRKISRFLLIAIPSQITTVDDFAAEQTGLLDNVMTQINQKSTEIEIAVKDCVDAVLLSVPASSVALRPSASAVDEFYDSVWELVFHAVLMAVKRSINTLKDHIRSAKGAGIWILDRPLFKVNIDLVSHRIHTNPTLDDVQHSINCCALNVLRSVEVSPWASQSIKKPTIADRVRGSKEIVRVVLLLTGCINKTGSFINNYLASLNSFQGIWSEDVQQQCSHFMTQPPSIEGFIEKLSSLDLVMQEVTRLPSACSIGPICLSHESFKKSLLASTQALKVALCASLCSLSTVELKQCMTWMTRMSTKLRGGVRDLDDVKNVRLNINEIIAKTFEIEGCLSSVDNTHGIAQEFGYSIPDEDQALLKTVRLEWLRLNSNSSGVLENLRMAQDTLKSDLMKTKVLFYREVKQFCLEFFNDGPLDPKLIPSVAIGLLKTFQDEYDVKMRKIHSLNEGEELFGLPICKYTEMVEVKSNLVELQQLYSLHSSVSQYIDQYLKWPLDKFLEKFANVELEVHKFHRRILQLPQKYMTYVAFKEMSDMIENQLLVLPLLEMVMKSEMQPRHWEEIMVLTGKSVDFSGCNFSAKELLELNLPKFSTELRSICTSAQKESACAAKMNSINDIWQKSTISFQNFKAFGPVLLDVFDTKTLMDNIEESQISLSLLLETKFSVGIISSIIQTRSKLSTLHDIFDLWLQVQSLYCNVEAVLSTKDAVKQLPQEINRFQIASNNLISLSQDAQTLRFSLALFDHEEKIRSRLCDLRNQLEANQHCLAIYLSAKKEIFPRLFFVSDSVMLDILSCGLEFLSKQHFLATIFENINCLLLKTDDTNAIIAVKSREGEVLHLRNSVLWEENVEKLLASVNQEIKYTVRKSTELVQSNLSENFANARIDVLNASFPGQICIIGFQCWWTLMCVDCFCQPEKDLSYVLIKISSILSSMVLLISTATIMSERSKLQSFLENILIQKDLTQHLYHQGTNCISSFDWQKQMHFRWSQINMACEVQSLEHVLEHNYEYTGCNLCLSIPCLSNRTFLFVFEALVSTAGCRLVAASGTSKTETLKDLGRKLGRFFMEFVSAADLGNEIMERFLTGVFRSGAWGCFDRLERMSSSVLAVVASCFISALDALRAGKHSFIFGEGQKMVLDKSSAVFCCSAATFHATNQVNSLPDNLKFIFRNLSLLPPDYSVFIRIKLGAAQFVNTNSLSLKINCMYQFCQEAFGDNKCYDFSFRSIQHLVDHLLILKLTARGPGSIQEMNEFKATEHVMRKLHLPRLASEDIPLFTTYLSELFDKQGDAQQDISSNQLELSHEVRCRLEHGADFIDAKWFPEIKTKVTQIFESSSVRHALILCGPTCTGKSLSLASLISKLSNIQECPHKALHINPMAITHDHLFGWFDDRDNKWNDGVITSGWRRAMRSKALHTWIILEGPIESAWIEKLDTVFDDAKVLTLANGDRLPIENYMHIVLEVADLRACSPSIITRTAVVAFTEPFDGIRHIVDEWLFGRRAEEAENLRPLLAAYVEPICDFVGAECRQDTSLLVQHRSQVQTFFVLLTTLLSDSVLAEEFLDPFVLERFVIYSLAWAMMGLLDENDRQKVHRRLAELSSNVPPARGNRTVLDYELLDTDSSKQSWVALTPSGGFRDGCAEKTIQSGTYCLSNLFVPTVSSEGVSRLNRILQGSGYPLFIAGDVGSGKSTLANRCLVEGADIPSSVFSKILLSKGDSPYRLQEFLFRRLRRTNGRIYGPLQGKAISILIEDLNAPQANEYGDHSVSEFLRFFLERRSLPPPKIPEELFEIRNVRILGTISKVSGRTSIGNRLRRFGFTICVLNPSKESIKNIFEPAFLARYSDAYQCTGIISDDTWTAVKVCVDATADLILSLRQHAFQFNLHSIARIRQGFIQVGPEQLNSPLAVISLWNHECERELLDGLTNSNEFNFEDYVKKISALHFGFEIASTPMKYTLWTHLASFSESKLVNFRRVYQATESNQKYEHIQQSCKDLLIRHNKEISAPAENLELTLVRDLVMHLIRLVRILSLERGHAILISDSGTGKSSVTRLAAFFLSYPLISRPKHEPWTLQGVKENLKSAYNLAGKRGLPVIISVTIFPTTSEDVLNLLSSSIACVDTDIFSTEEWGALSSSPEFQLYVEHERSKSESLQNLDSQSLFAHRIQRLCHFVVKFSMSPLQFRSTVKSLPTFVTLCSVSIWPAYSLSSLEEYASENFHVLAAKLESHRLEVANPYIEAELMKKIRDEEEQNVASGGGHGRWNSDDVTQAITEAVAEEARLREDLMSKVRESVPKQMAGLHALSIRLSQSYHMQRGIGDQSFCSFANFRLYILHFCEVYVEKFEEIYSKHLKLKSAVEALESCDRDILALHTAAPSYRSRTVEASMLCDSILQEIKIYVAEFQQEKLHRMSLDEKHTQVDIKIDDIKDQAQKYFAYFDDLEAQLFSSSKQLTPNLFAEIATFNPPPTLVTRVFDITLIFLSKPLNRITVTAIRGRACFNDSWSQVLELMENVEMFVSEIQKMKYSEITAEQIELLQPYLSDEDLTVDKARTTAKGLCVPLVRWIKKVESFLMEFHTALPIMSEFRNLQSKLSTLKASIPLSSQKVEDLSKKVDELRKRYDEAVALRHVQESSDESRRHTLRGAQDLLKGLKPQKGRWAAELLALDLERQHLAGNCSISAAFLTYCGVFDIVFRRQALDSSFPGTCSTARVPCTVPLDVVRFLCDEYHIYQFRREELPADDYLHQSALICSRSKPWPLLIDPNNVATRWILAKEKLHAGSSIRLLRVADLQFISILQECLVHGASVLIQDVDEDVSWNLSDVFLLRTGTARGKSARVKIGSGEIECHPSFQMYLVTASVGMHFSESFAASVMIINFTSSAGAMDLQLLELILKVEQPTTFMDQASLISSDADFSAGIREKREMLLTLVCSLEGKILDKNDVVQEIDQIKFDLQSMAKQRGQNLKKMEFIQPIISKYLAIARRTRRILTCISKLAPLDHFYTYTMSHYLKLLDLTLRETHQQAFDGKVGAESILKRITRTFLNHVSAMVSTEHKSLWNVILAMHVDSELDDDLDTVIKYLTAPLSLEATVEFSDLEFESLSAESVLGLKKFISFCNNKHRQQKTCLNNATVLCSLAFKEWYRSEQPEKSIYELEISICETFSSFERMLLVLCLRKDRFFHAAARYVQTILDVESPEFEHKLNTAEGSVIGLHDILKLSDSHTPIIIISPGSSDASAIIKRIAVERGVVCRAAFGLNQTVNLKNHINSGLVLGLWLILDSSNIHTSVLSLLPSFLDNATDEKGKFRLFITIYTTYHSFPKSLLRLSLITRVEQPASIRSCVFGTFDQMEPKFLETLKDPSQIRLILAMSILYGLVQGRVKYYDAGWSVPYCFREPDFIETINIICASVSKAASKSFNPQFSLPWETIQKMVSELYFSRVITDQNDKQVLSAYVQRYASAKILADDFEFLPALNIPSCNSIPSLLTYSMQLPEFDDALMFGLPFSSDSERYKALSNRLFSHLVVVSGTQIPLLDVSGHGMQLRKFFDQVVGIHNSVIDKVSHLSDLHFEKNQTTRGGKDSKEPEYKLWSFFTRNEADRMLRALEPIQALFVKCNRLDADVLFHEDEADVLCTLQCGSVPSNWTHVSWPASTLAAWMNQLRNRWIQLRSWLNKEDFPSYWLGGFFNPGKFVRITSVEASQYHGWQLECVGVSLQIKYSEIQDAKQKQIHGICLVGALWDERAAKLTSAKGALSRGPEMCLVAKIIEEGTDDKFRDSFHFKAPCFKAGSRLAHDFLIDAFLPTNEPPQKLILRSCALFLNHEALFEMLG